MGLKDYTDEYYTNENIKSVKSINQFKSLPLPTGRRDSDGYDIVKAHGGEINVNTKEIEGKVFSVILGSLNAQCPPL